jgi:hypothetical protein
MKDLSYMYMTACPCMVQGLATDLVYSPLCPDDLIRVKASLELVYQLSYNSSVILRIKSSQISSQMFCQIA